MSHPEIETFTLLEADYSLLSTSIQDQLDNLISSTSQLEEAFSEARRLLEQMHLRLQAIPNTLRQPLTAKYRTDSRTLDEQYKQFQQFRSTKPSDLRTVRVQSNSAAQLQRDQLLVVDSRIQNSTASLQRSQRLAQESESIGADVLQELRCQRETIERTGTGLQKSEGALERSMKSIKELGKGWFRF
ncbi:hypothetical protein BJ508DRAFT_414588 [Ascobolus immersus RN42]|uniref:t-SNARE coiled-coil homology domain-containing protein n=1 Tax=Ascobolus immersus RN42 TaxID=1160509 RepID=A0A3N4I8S5_ASCIM|nr:hypothetical protein BJ508DRAFT_414588 [Ascobolus immersus RN42]